MKRTFEPISYAQLNSRQKEAYNLQLVSALLAELGFVTIRMTSDWGGADFIAQHIHGEFLKVQLKSRLSFSKKYYGQQLYVCFRSGDRWYLYPHDEMLDQNLSEEFIGRAFWDEYGGYTNPKPSIGQLALLEPYTLERGRPISL